MFWVIVIALVVALAIYIYTLPRPYYDFNKICGDFDANNLEEDPHYFDPKDYPWVQTVESNWKIIRDELEEYLKKQELIPYFGDNLMSRKQCWKVLGLKFWNLDNKEPQSHFPRTMEILNSIPGLSLVAFSQIDSNGGINPHNGDTNANIRCHLGLIVPGSLPEIGFSVGEEKKSWEEGKVLMFCDAHRHYAFNNTSKTRIILQFDVIRPKYQRIRNLVSARILASICTQKTSLILFPVKRGEDGKEIGGAERTKKVVRAKYLLRAIYYSLIPFMYIAVRTQIGAEALFKFFLDKL